MEAGEGVMGENKCTGDPRQFRLISEREKDIKRKVVGNLQLQEIVCLENELIDLFLLNHYTLLHSWEL